MQRPKETIKSILDMGCGPGNSSAQIARTFPSVIEKWCWRISSENHKKNI
jgi:trans-aconitate methyltransferase